MLRKDIYQILQFEIYIMKFLLFINAENDRVIESIFIFNKSSKNMLN